MRALVVVVVGPNANLCSSVIEPEEQRLVQEFVAHAPVEAFAKAVLHRLSRRDVTPFDPMFARP